MQPWGHPQLGAQELEAGSAYLKSGALDCAERLKNPPGKGQKDCFDEQLWHLLDWKVVPS